MHSLTKFLKFIPTAQAAASYSKDPSTKVGAIAIDDDYNIRAQGYNGFPRGVKDTEDRLNDREQKYPRIVHAEANLVAMAARSGVSLQGCSVLLTSLHPCSSCAGLLIQAGIKRVFAPHVSENTRWDASSAVALEMFNEAGVAVYTYDGMEITSCRIDGGIELYGERWRKESKTISIDEEKQKLQEALERLHKSCERGPELVKELDEMLVEMKKHIKGVRYV